MFADSHYFEQKLDPDSHLNDAESKHYFIIFSGLLRTYGTVPYLTKYFFSMVTKMSR
jgi:hypothetical protein